MVLRILYILLLTLVIPDTYLYFKLMYRKERPLWAQIAFFLPNTILLLSALLLAVTESHTPENMTLMMIFFNMYMLVALPKTLFMMLDIIGLGLGLIFKKIRKAFTVFSTIISVSLFIIMLIGMTYGPSHLVVKEVEYSSKDLPASFDGYRIVQFTDMHLTSFRNRPHIVDHIVQTILDQKADMIVFTGDLVSTDVDEMDGFEEPLSRLWAPDGVYAVLGNHDIDSDIIVENVTRILTAADFSILNNQNIKVRNGGSSYLNFVGIESMMLGNPDISLAYEGVSDNAYTIALCHTPDIFDTIDTNKTDLLLAGHSHGGQINIPLIVNNFLPDGAKKYFHGRYVKDNTILDVSNGVGTTKNEARIFADAQINVYKFKSGQ